jgi:hypothetical protein
MALSSKRLVRIVLVTTVVDIFSYYGKSPSPEGARHSLYTGDAAISLGQKHLPKWKPEEPPQGRSRRLSRSKKLVSVVEGFLFATSRWRRRCVDSGLLACRGTLRCLCAVVDDLHSTGYHVEGRCITLDMEECQRGFVRTRKITARAAYQVTFLRSCRSHGLPIPPLRLGRCVFVGCQQERYAGERDNKPRWPRQILQYKPLP